MPKAANPATQGVVSAALADTDAVSAPLVSYRSACATSTRPRLG